MNLKSLTDSELIQQLKTTVNDERRLTTEVLHYLYEVESRLLFAELGYSSLYEFCTQHLGYSNGSAYRRIESMRLLKSLSSSDRLKTEENIKSGKVTLSNLSLLQGFLKTEKRESGKVYSNLEKTNLLQSIENKSKREVERELSAIQPLIMKPEKERVISPELTEIKFTADSLLMKKLSRVKEVLAHVNPNLTYAELLHKLTDEFLERKDPVKKAERIVNKRRVLSAEQTPSQNSPPEGQELLFKPIPKSLRAPRYIPSPIRHEVWLRDQGRCTYRNSQTNHTCNSQFGLELAFQPRI